MIVGQRELPGSDPGDPTAFYQISGHTRSVLLVGLLTAEYGLGIRLK